MSYEIFKRDINNKDDWRLRWKAVKGLKTLDDRRAKDVLWHAMISDKVFLIQEEAFRALQAKGEQVKLPKKKKGDLIKDFRKKLKTVKSQLSEGHSYEDFKSELNKKYPVIYDTYEGDKIYEDIRKDNKTEEDIYNGYESEKFNNWLENTWKSL